MKRRHPSRGGSVLIELTLMLPFLTLMFLGAWQFGNAFWVLSELENAVRAGARYGSMRLYRSSTSTPSSDYVATVSNTVVYGDAFTSSGTPVVRNLTPANVVITMPGFDASPVGPKLVRVCITGYNVGFFWSIPLTNKPCAEFPYVSNWAPVS